MSAASSSPTWPMSSISSSRLSRSKVETGQPISLGVLDRQIDRSIGALADIPNASERSVEQRCRTHGPLSDQGDAGVLLSNREIVGESPHLTDLTVAVLDEFGVAAAPEMIGKDCLGAKKF